MKLLIKILFSSFLLFFWCCVTTINIDQINEYYKSGDEKAIESILNNPDILENSEDIVTVKEYYSELKKSRIEAEIKTVIENEDITILERIVTGEYDEYVTEEQKKEVIVLYKNLLIKQVETDISEAINTGDCEKFYEYAVSKKDLIEPQQAVLSEKYLKMYTNADSRILIYKQNKMEKVIRLISKETMSNIFTDPANYIEILVKELSARTRDQYLIVKNIHDWICDNISYDTNDYFNNLELPQDYVSVLERKTAVCAGYSELFRKMCEIAGYEVKVISGYSKGFGYRGQISGKSDHAWNGIKINDKWYLVDCTWDAGFVDRKIYIKEYSTDYLFINSREMLFSHLPEDNKNQFYYPVVSKEQFSREPMIEGAFFQYGLSLKNDSLLYDNNIEKNPYILELISTNRNLLLSSELRTDNMQDINGGSFIRRKGNQYEVYFSPPDGKEYKGNIFARLNTEYNFPRKINISEFEDYYLLQVDKFIEENKYKEEVKEIFKNSYIKIEENNKYYYLEDQFDVQRINTVFKIFKYIDAVNYSKNILKFNLQSSDTMMPAIKYPDVFAAYNKTVNTEIIEPIQRNLKPGAIVNFRIASTDYRYFAVIHNSEWSYFTKDSSGIHALDYKIPSDAKTISIYGGQNKNGQFQAIVKYYITE